MPLKRAAPHLRPCLLVPSCSLGWMQRSVQLRGGSRARGNLAVPACMLPGAPWEMGPADRAWGSHHPLPAAPLFLQPWLAETGKVLDGQCFKKHGSSLLHWGAARATQGPSKAPSLCGLAARTGCEQEGFIFEVSGDLRLWMQPRSRLAVGTRAFVCLLWFLVPCCTCTLASSQQRAISTSANLEVKQKLLLDKLFK